MSLSFLLLVAITLISSFFLFKFLTRSGTGPKNLPRGSLGFPLIGETFSFLQAQRKGRRTEWINERVSKHGPVFKTSLMGSPTVVIIGQAGNKFILGSREDVIGAIQPKALATITGKYNLFGLTGSRYKLVKGAIVSFLKPESLQIYVKQMDDLVKTLLLRETGEKDTIATVIFMKKLTFNIACDILFGIHDEHTRMAFFNDFTLALKALWSIPVNFPGTIYWHGLRARSRIINRLLPIVRKRKEDISMGILKPKSDVISSLLAFRAENKVISEEMILDNFITLIIGSQDTSATLLSLMVWKMSRDPKIYQKVLEEQMGILRSKEGTDEYKLTWTDIQKMKVTWRVAQELMRIIPPVFGGFRQALKDTSYVGYDIPKGWQLFWVSCGTHMNNDIFDNPMEFDPSRFENSSKTIPPYAYIPFGGGLHMCIGNEFARVETLTTIHRLITMYEWSPVHPNEVITFQPTPYPSMGLPIKVKPRIL